MKFRRGKPEAALWLLVAGAVLTGAAAAFAVSRLLKAPPIARRRELRSLEKRIVDTLRDDPIAGAQAIDVAAVGAGTVELSGMVETRKDARHAVEVVNDIPGVRAVLNRLEIRAVEAKLKGNQFRRGDSTGTRWYGGSVGMGRRRQSFTTDPARPDDHADLLERALQPNRDDALTGVEEEEGTGVRIGVSRGGAFTTEVAPSSPDRHSDEPGPPPSIQTTQPQ